MATSIINEARVLQAEMAFLEAPSSTMGSVASDLKTEREKRRITLPQIAADTRISLHYLESLEEGRYGDLPGGMYNRAFLRAYCEFIDLDPKEILRRFEAELSPAVEKTSKSRKRIPQQNKLARHYPIFVWSLMLLISATGLFFSRKWIASIFSPYFSRTPAAVVRYKPSAKPAAPPATATVTEPEAAAPPSETPSGSPVAQAAAPADAQTIPASAVPATPLRLDVEATEECWISIDTDGQPSIRRLLKPGEAQSFGASEQFTIIAGNAAGVRLKINGKPAKPLGKSGAVVKVQIDKTNLQDFIDQTVG